MPHAEHTGAWETNLPSFPDNVPTAPLLRISLFRLLARDPGEEERCWRACCDLGFFYLDLGASDGGRGDGEGGDGDGVGKRLQGYADQLFEVMREFFGLGVEEKTRFDFAEQGSYFGYKGYGKGVIDAKGSRDRNEFYNVSKDDILGLSERLSAPQVLDAYRALFEEYIRASHGLCMLIASLLSDRLSLRKQVKEEGGLAALHELRTTSGDQIRFVRAPPQTLDDIAVALGEHTDFGSVTILFNRLGGLQVRLPHSMAPVAPDGATPCSSIEKDLCRDGWTYVRPLPNHCIVNLGDALVKFSGGRLRSNIHRVVPPPGEQGKEERYSLVYFCRPGDDVVLESLVEGEEGDGEGVNAKEWILRRALGRRRADGWRDSGGTEEVSMRGGV